MTDDRFSEIRQAIDELDSQLVETVNARLRLVNELWQLKREQGVHRSDPGREAAMRARLADQNAGPLSSDGLDALVTEILALMREELGR